MDDAAKIISEEILKNDNKKVKMETLDEYLFSFKRDELARLAIPNVFINMDYLNLYKVRNLANKPKKYIVDYIKDNLEKVLEVYIKIIDSNKLAHLEMILNNKNKDCLVDMAKLSLDFISFLKSFSLAKVEYNSKEETIKIFMPADFVKIFKKALKNKKLLEENVQNNKIFTYVENVIDTYGIITIDKMHEIFEKQMFKMDKTDLMHSINVMSFVTEINIYHYQGTVLLCNIEFADEDYALDFYESQKGSYKIFTKNQYKEISDRTYIQKLQSYRKFINYLFNNYGDISEAMDYVDNFIVYDYINFAQISLQDADRAFRINIVKMFEMDRTEVDTLLKLMREIFNQFPKWKKRGRV